MEEEKDIYSNYNASDLDLSKNPETDDLKAENTNEVMEPETEPEDPDIFYIRSSQGISINGCGMQRGKYRLGDKIYGSGYPITIDENIRNSALSLDAQSIVSNPHLAD